ncbi:hypothetical protein [Flavobacterium frigoris]|uniref:OmpA/MotB domain protein n=1 Tax=Flavobacterium frigoris (strain PS1) TaxID=1086011 RepID=H7FM26_FLAFP|nr:hypothetical protein [Flavobacterium frigoris]EIA10484.1 ompA/MotB domain protein [Flavobacterium frigoris PS1]
MIIQFKFVIALAICLTFTQLSHGQYFAEVNYGLNGSIYPTTHSLAHTGVGFGYMDPNTTLGAKLDFGLDKFRTNNTGKELGSDLYRLSLQAVCNISNLINERSYYDRINVLIHSGLGYTLAKPISTKKINDHIVNVIMGITPKYKLSRNIALTLDASLLFNIAQSYRYDIDYDLPNKRASKFTGTNYNAAAGILYTFDSN